METNLQNKTTKIDLRILAEIGILAAISFVLNLIEKACFSGVWVNGGGIKFSIIPIIILCYRRGPLAGFISALIVMIISFLGGVYSISDTWYKVMLQILLDYILATPLLATAGIFYKPFKNANSQKKKYLYLALGVVVATLFQFLTYFLSGVLFWPTPADGWNVQAGAPYSLLYNGSYMLPTMIIVAIIVVLIYKKAPQLIELDKKENQDEE